jgi:hypothetical protein
MTPRLTLAAFLAAFPVGAAMADDDCRTPMNSWQPREAVVRLAEENGWIVNKIEIDDGCYEITGRDRDGRRIEVELDPGTLQVIEMEIGDDDDDDRRGRPNPAPAGTVAPPQNGLFGTGAPPQVKVN